MAFSNIVILGTPTSGAQQEEYNRSERAGFYSPNREPVNIVIFDKLGGDASGTIQTNLEYVIGGRVLKRDGTVIAGATVKPSGNGSVASLAGLDDSTTCVAEIYGYEGVTGRTLS